MRKCDCEICKHWAASQSNDFPCDECDGKSYFEYADAPISSEQDTLHPI
jgi:hypothetical protein